MIDLRSVNQRLDALEADQSFLAQMVGLVIVDQATRADIARLSEIGARDLSAGPEGREYPWEQPSAGSEGDEPHDDLSTPAEPA